MYGKALFFVVLVVLGAVLPYIMADEKWLADVEARFAKTGAPETSGGAPAVGSPSGLSFAPATVPVAKMSNEDLSKTLGSPGAAIANSPTSVTATPVPVGSTDEGIQRNLPRVVGPPLPLEYLLNFDVSPDWVSENWSRVSMRLAELHLQGWRVPVAFGGGPSKFAGSITYYFDAQRRVQRILVHGYAANAHQLLSLATNRYQMQRTPSRYGDLYVAKIKEQTAGALLIKYPSISRPSDANRLELMMELNREGSQYGMSLEFLRVLESMAKDLELTAPTPDA